MLRCNKCKQERDEELFYKRNGKTIFPCKVCYREGAQKYYADNNDVEAKKRVDNYKELRKKILDHYGGACSCCGEKRYEFLAIDHKNGGGGKQRKELAISGKGMMYYIIRNNYPDSYRVLCHNCNLSLGFYGYCPHN